MKWFSLKKEHGSKVLFSENVWMIKTFRIRLEIILALLNSDFIIKEILEQKTLKFMPKPWNSVE